MKRSRTLLSFDIEEFDLPEEFQVKVPAEDRNRISAAGTRAILDAVNSAGVKATFFTTGYFAERNQDMIREMAAKGHEVASHGMNHSFFEVSHLKESRKLLQEISGQEITGFRMARLAKVDKEEILAAGYQYESSLNPVWLPGRYSNFGKPLLPFRETCGLWQFPVSAVPVVRFPLFWLSFKNLPLPLYQLMAKTTAAMTGYFNMYSHPWEYNEASKDPKWNIPGYIVRYAGKDQTERLCSLILSLQKNGDFITFREYLTQKENE